MKRLLFSLLLIGCAGRSYALDCAKAVTTADINECASIEQKKVEDKLNKLYQGIVKPLEGDEKKTLVEAQRAWIKFREADCNAVYQRWIDGTIRNVLFISCMQDRAETRIKELQEYAKTY